MVEGMVGIAIEDHIADVVERLRDGGVDGLDACDLARLVAITDERVVTKIVERFARGYLARGVRWLPPDRVLWLFDCLPGAATLAPVGFVVVVDLEARTVVDVIDPYDPEAEEGDWV